MRGAWVAAFFWAKDGFDGVPAKERDEAEPFDFADVFSG
jgi:hypothetical protein